MTLPPGAMPGTQMSVAVPEGLPSAGQPVQFVVPPGVQAGAVIAVPLPSNNSSNAGLKLDEISLKHTPPPLHVSVEPQPQAPHSTKEVIQPPGKGGGHGDDLKSWLDEHSLGRIEQKLREYGAETASDLKDLDEDDINSLGLKPVEKKKLLRVLKK